MGAEPRDELGQPERLGQIVIGPGVQRHHDLELLRTRGQHDDHGLGEHGAQPAAQVDPLDVGQPEVEKDEIRRMPPGRSPVRPARSTPGSPRSRSPTGP